MPIIDEARAASREAGVVWWGLLALGVGFGVVVTGLNLPWWLAPMTAALMFAGSAEFVIVGMLAAGASVVAVVMTTALINARHLFYGLTFPLNRVDGRLGKTYSMYALCDEAYVLIAGERPDDLSSTRILWTQAGLNVSWVGGALIGALFGHAFLTDINGLGFILVALFIVLAIDALRASDATTAVLAVVSSVVAFVIAPNAMVLTAMALFALALLARHRIAVRS